jgi:tripartite-type tricarboxylate transporter receptor subunit TctC
MKLNVLACLAAATVVVCAWDGALADSFPSRPIAMIVPSAPGGGNDLVARVIADAMGRELNQRVIVENRSGAGGTIGINQVARSPADGYTIALGSSATMAIAPNFYKEATYNPQTDFTSIGLICDSPLVLMVNPSLPVHTAKDLIEFAKKEDGKLVFASGGRGTPAHVAAKMFENMANIHVIHNPYKGAGPAMNDLMGNFAQMLFTSVPPAIGNIKGGRLRAIAVSSKKRTDALPDVPTIAESAIPGFEASQRYWLIAPLGLPKDIVKQLNTALNAALAADGVKKILAQEGATLMPSTPEEAQDNIKAEGRRWAEVSKMITDKSK